MARSPHDRYATARDVATEVERYLADERVLAYREPLQRALVAMDSPPPHAVLSLMAAAVVAMAALSIGVTMLKRSGTAPEHDLQARMRSVSITFA